MFRTSLIAAAIGAFGLAWPFVAFAIAQDQGEYSTVAEAREALMAKPGIQVRKHKGWLIIEDLEQKKLWSFTPSSHEAYPAVVSRQPVEENNMLAIKMQVMCQAPEPECKRLLKSFEALNDSIRQDVVNQQPSDKR